MKKPNYNGRLQRKLFGQITRIQIGLKPEALPVSSPNRNFAMHLVLEIILISIFNMSRASLHEPNGIQNLGSDYNILV